jgi:hypothetical protein
MAKKEIPAKQLDKRLVNRFLDRGTYSRTDLDAHLATLPDVADKGDDIAALVYVEGSKSSDA